MLMAAVEVLSSSVAVITGGAQGNFELNACPILVSTRLRSAPNMAGMCNHLPNSSARWAPT
jgi:fumarate hydratase class II